MIVDPRLRIGGTDQWHQHHGARRSRAECSPVFKNADRSSAQHTRSPATPIPFNPGKAHIRTAANVPLIPPFPAAPSAAQLHLHRVLWIMRGVKSRAHAVNSRPHPVQLGMEAVNSHPHRFQTRPHSFPPHPHALKLRLKRFQLHPHGVETQPQSVTALPHRVTTQPHRVTTRLHRVTAPKIPVTTHIH